MRLKLLPLVFASLLPLSQFACAAEKPEIKFTAVDGRKVDLAQLRGKVVLIDFWATWCTPCVAELPHVLDTYKKFHDKGFEVIGISFDQNKDLLASFIKERGMAWPQSLDKNDGFSEKFGIEVIPTMWLVDKEGNVVTKNAKEDLAGKVEKLLAK